MRARMKRSRMLALAAAVSLAAAGCSSATTGSIGSVPSEPTATSIGAGEGVLNIVAWAGYVEYGQDSKSENWVAPFTAQTGCKVNLTIGNTSDQMVQLMKTGKYDVVSASGDATLRLIYGGEVVPINTKLISTWSQIYSDLKDTAYNSVGGVSYGVPQGRGANLLMYNTTDFKTAPTSWSSVFDSSTYSSYAGKITDYSSPIYIADAALYLMKHNTSLGITNPYALDTTQLAAAVQLLKSQHSAVGSYWSNYQDEINAFESGNSTIGTTWQVTQNTIASDGKAKTKAVLPTEGATGWSDTWMVSSAKGTHTNCAYKWLNYISSATVNGHVAGYYGEAPANAQACTEAAKESGLSGFCDQYHADDPTWWKNVYLWTTPTATCLDGRTSVKCTDYAAWEKAWTDITS